MAKQILVVDDSNATRAMIMFALGPHGCAVSGASDGEEGLKLLEQEHFDIIVTDLNMPRMSGIDFVKAVRATNDGAGVPIVVVSSDIRQERKESALSAGATAFLPKPVSMGQLAWTVEKLTGPINISSSAWSKPANGAST